MFVYSDSVLARWEGQVEGLKMYLSYQDAVGIGGEANEFEWKNFPASSSLTILQEIPKDLARKNINPEELKDRIIFMSMFNDIGWSKRKNDETIHFNGDSTNRTLVPHNSICKSAQYLRSSGELVSTIWPGRGGEGTSQFVCGQKILTSLQLEEVQLLVSRPTKASRNGSREDILNFEALSSRIQFSQLCEKPQTG